ncbi:MAG: hypothetical protein ACREYC_15400 [Gammaproteobacteria bacterium]
MSSSTGPIRNQMSRGAKQLYRTGIQRFPNSSALFNNGALFFERRGQYDEAERLYREAYERELYSQAVKLLVNVFSVAHLEELHRSGAALSALRWQLSLQSRE